MKKQQQRWAIISKRGDVIRICPTRTVAREFVRDWAIRGARVVQFDKPELPTPRIPVVRVGGNWDSYSQGIV